MWINHPEDSSDFDLQLPKAIEVPPQQVIPFIPPEEAREDEPQPFGQERRVRPSEQRRPCHSCGFIAYGVENNEVDQIFKQHMLSHVETVIDENPPPLPTQITLHCSHASCDYYTVATINEARVHLREHEYYHLSAADRAQWNAPIYHNPWSELDEEMPANNARDQVGTSRQVAGTSRGAIPKVKREQTDSVPQDDESQQTPPQPHLPDLTRAEFANFPMLLEMLNQFGIDDYGSDNLAAGLNATLKSIVESQDEDKDGIILRKWAPLFYGFYHVEDDIYVWAEKNKQLWPP